MTDRGGDGPGETEQGDTHRPDGPGEAPGPSDGSQPPDADGDVTHPDAAREPHPDTAREPPPHRRQHEDDVPAPTQRPIAWFRRTEHPLVLASRDILTSAVLVAMVGLALFAVSGVWPPLVAIESGSMEPHMSKGDLVVVVEESRFGSQAGDGNGVLTSREGARIGHSQFGAPGDVIVFRPDGSDQTPIIHRAIFFVEAGENWVQAADPRYLQGQDCQSLDTCPAQHDGYITRGDANGGYDQVTSQSDVVRPSWIEGRAVARVPYLGCVRLQLSGGPSCLEDESRRVGG